jgi:transcriptional regulator with GAF, ATPase, and Fis domain
MNREQQLVEVFVRLADTLTTEFEVIDLMQTLADTSRDILPASATGILLADQRGHLRVLATTHPAAELLELFEIQTSEGPCYDCFHSGAAVVNLGHDASIARWPRFMSRAVDAGYRTVHALPLRLRDDVIGTMNLFSTGLRNLEPQDVLVAQGLCDVATIGLMQERAVREKHVLAEQLQGALNSRILIEQAKGIISERNRIGVDEAFELLRQHGRSHNQRLTDVAAGLIQGTVQLGD